MMTQLNKCKGNENIYKTKKKKGKDNLNLYIS